MREAFASLAILLAASAAHADIARGTGSRAAPQTQTPSVETASLAAGGGILASAQAPVAYGPASACHAGGAFPAVPRRQASTGDEAPLGRIVTLPPAPGCDALCLSGLLSIGALQALRRARHLHLNLPEWYHADALRLQIGHSVPFDPTAGSHIQPACLAPILPARVSLSPFPHIARELPSRCTSQFFLAIEAPRGPPVVS